MSAFLISLLVAVGSATWLWTKVGRRTGGADPKSAAVTAAAAAIAVFVVVFTLLKIVLHIS